MAVHGQRYGYARVEYRGAGTKVLIECREHGPFAMLPSNHLRGSGYPECARITRAEKRRFDSAEILRRARAMHGERYEYLEVRCASLVDPLRIRCSEHGEFSQRAGDHIRGKGCPVCGRRKADANRTLSNDTFLARALKVHGDRYDYSDTVYRGAHQYVTIRCREHGPFRQKANNHWHGNGCPACRDTASRERHAWGPSEFLERARVAHGTRYDLSRARYVNAWTKILASCGEHGDFEQYPAHLVRGVGCPGCANDRRGDAFRMPTEQFLARARTTHGDRYDYPGVTFANLREHIDIICRRHGAFRQTAWAHIAGAGCPQCVSSRGERAVAAWLEQRGIAFIHQWMDHDCVVNTGRARFDFYLPDRRAIIEYDGEQHFAPVTFGADMSEADALEQLELRQIVDFLKDDWAAGQGLRMIRVRYDEEVADVLGRVPDLLGTS